MLHKTGPNGSSQRSPAPTGRAVGRSGCAPRSDVARLVPHLATSALDLALRRRERRGEGTGIRPRRRRRPRHRARVPAVRVHVDNLGDEGMRAASPMTAAKTSMPAAYVPREEWLKVTSSWRSGSRSRSPAAVRNNVDWGPRQRTPSEFRGRTERGESGRVATYSPLGLPLELSLRLCVPASPRALCALTSPGVNILASGMLFSGRRVSGLRCERQLALVLHSSLKQSSPRQSSLKQSFTKQSSLKRSSLTVSYTHLTLPTKA